MGLSRGVLWGAFFFSAVASADSTVVLHDRWEGARMIGEIGYSLRDGSSQVVSYFVRTPAREYQVMLNGGRPFIWITDTNCPSGDCKVSHTPELALVPFRGELFQDSEVDFSVSRDRSTVSISVDDVLWMKFDIEQMILTGGIIGENRSVVPGPLKPPAVQCKTGWICIQSLRYGDSPFAGSEEDPASMDRKSTVKWADGSKTEVINRKVYLPVPGWEFDRSSRTWARFVHSSEASLVRALK